MSLSEKESSEEQTEALVETLNIEGATLTETNLSNLSSSDIQTLTELSQDLTLTNEMETEENEIVVEQASTEEDSQVESETADESTREIELEQTSTLSAETKPKTTSVPPLRPLNIAPKPAKVPIAVKPVAGQQLLLVQGAGSGQAIKLVAAQGQELNLANFAITRPIQIKPAIKTVNTQSGNIIVQQKPVVMKKIVTTGQKTIGKPLTTFTNKQGQHFMVVQKAEQQQQPVKLIQTSNVQTIPSPTKTITLQQAQEMGLLTSAKFLPQSQSTPKLITKSQQKTIKLVPQVSSLVTSTGTKTITVNQIKSPTKILPATSGSNSPKTPQRIIFKTTGTNQTIIPSGQIIQVAGTQPINTNQVHQINIPGKGMQYIKFITTSNTETNTSPASSTKTTSANIVLSEIKPVITSNIIPKTIKPVQKQVAVSAAQMVVLPSNFATISTTQKQPSPVLSTVAVQMRHNSNIAKPAPAVQSPNDNVSLANDTAADSNGIRPRKPCNCTKSQCLKLYCDCFANGEFCYMCNCMNCFNNLENEEHRNRAIKACLERNPNAFRPKIGKAKDTSGDLSIRKHTKGCNCKRSGCLKNYCECYEAKIACSNNCKCFGCRNIEDSLERKNLQSVSFDNSLNKSQIVGGKSMQSNFVAIRPARTSTVKQPINFITDDVIEATCQCLLALTDGAEADIQDEDTIKRQIIEEFGRCLTEIIGCSINRD